MRFRERMKIVLLHSTDIKDEIADLMRRDDKWRGNDGEESPIKTAATPEFI